MLYTFTPPPRCRQGKKAEAILALQRRKAVRSIHKTAVSKAKVYENQPRVSPAISTISQEPRACTPLSTRVRPSTTAASTVVIPSTASSPCCSVYPPTGSIFTDVCMPPSLQSAIVPSVMDLGLGVRSGVFGGACAVGGGDGAGNLAVEGLDFMTGCSGHCYVGRDHSDWRHMSPVPSPLPHPDTLGFSDGSPAGVVRCIDRRSPRTNNGDKEKPLMLTVNRKLGEDFECIPGQGVIRNTATAGTGQQKRQSPSPAPTSSVAMPPTRSRGQLRSDGNGGGDYRIDDATTGGMLSSPLAAWSTTPPPEQAPTRSVRPKRVGGSIPPATNGDGNGTHNNMQHQSPPHPHARPGMPKPFHRPIAEANCDGMDPVGAGEGECVSLGGSSCERQQRRLGKTQRGKRRCDDQNDNHHDDGSIDTVVDASFTIGCNPHDTDHRGCSSGGGLLRMTSIAKPMSLRRPSSLRRRQDAPPAAASLAKVWSASASTASNPAWSQTPYRTRLTPAAAPAGTHDPLIEARSGQQKPVNSAFAASDRSCTLTSPPTAITNGMEVGRGTKSGWSVRVRGNDGVAWCGGGGGGGGGSTCRDNSTNNTSLCVDNGGGGSESNFGIFTAVEGDVSSDRLDACFLRELVPLLIQQKQRGRNRSEEAWRV